MKRILTVPSNCPKCSKSIEPRAATGFTNGNTPVASIYTEYFYCFDCDEEWFIMPYVEEMGT